LEPLTVALLLPLFFAYTGLRTRLGLVVGADLWFDCALIILTAIVGKPGGSMISARLTGMSWRDASALGILMNTRGLMELVVLNIGLDRGAVSPELFSMMVLMALITTFMTSPLIEWVYPTPLVRREAALLDGRETA
jgi:Kef-type K+ transport system membrane component KefB